MPNRAVASPPEMGERPPRPLRRRRIIERPRLIRALDRSQARVRMLVAPAGYGKTTLAEQWAQAGARQVAWFRARRSAIDVAVLARGLSAASREIVPGAGRRLEERLAVTQDPAREAVVLAEILASDLGEWPSDAWIVIDDYQFVSRSVAGEAFVETLAHQTPTQFLIASRQRPGWVSGRTILYGGALEITQTALAMDADEAEEVLEGRHPGLSAGLIAIAEGWPAVVGLARVADAEPTGDVEVPQELYEFFADEVYRSLEGPVRAGLSILAGLPLVDRALALEVLGDDVGRAVCEQTLSLGIVDEREGRLELHPLAAAFLEQRARLDRERDLESAARRALTIYRNGREWDAAFELVDRYGFHDQLEPLLTESLDELLNAGRLATLESWLDRTRPQNKGSERALSVVRAEVALRTGRHVTAQAVAERAVAELSSSQSELRQRALIVAARAAHIGSREEEALALFTQAENEAQSRRWKREALWGRLTAAAALEMDIAHELMARLESTTNTTDPDEIVRLADKRLALGFRFGAVRHLEHARRIAELVSEVADPNLRCSFRCTFAYALNLGAHYKEGLIEAGELVREAREYQIHFALSYGHLLQASSLAGLRDFPAGHRELDLADVVARECNDDFAHQAVYCARVRLLLQEGRVADACVIEPPVVRDALPGMRGEVLATRALALAVLGRLEDARCLAGKAVSCAVEVRVLSAAAEAVVAAKSREPGYLDRVEELVELGFETGAVDLVVTAYRASSEVLRALLRSPKASELAVFLVGRAGDSAMAGEVGYPISAVITPLARLTRREREISELAAAGLSNGEISQQLFIAESTVKSHLHRVYKKLGVKNRTALSVACGLAPRRSSRSSD